MSQKIGSISFNSKDVIGRGSSSVVYRGKFGTRVVAVKKVEKTKTNLIQKEVKLLQESDQSMNIVRYFTSEEDKDHHYLALEYCHCTLKEYVTRNDLKEIIDSRTIIKQIFNGMKWLHSLSIVHRDIKPTNVLLLQKTQTELVVKISDFGFAKQIEVSDSQMSVVPDESKYWIVPEMKNGRYNMKSDIYSTGCLCYYISKNGVISVKNDLLDFVWDSSFAETSLGVLLRHLLSVMTIKDEVKRPTFDCLLFHPFFWDNQMTLNFLVKTADRIKERDSLANEIKNLLQENADEIIGSDWTNQLERTVIDSLAYRSPRHNYGVYSVGELLRALRNKEAHYDETSPQVKQVFGSLPDGFTAYWTNKFPKLVLHVYTKLAKSSISQHPNFTQYYPKIQTCGNISSSN